MSGAVSLLLHDVELDPNFGNFPSGRFELLGNVFLYHSCVVHGHSGGHVSDYVHEHRSTGAHRAEVVDAQ